MELTGTYKMGTPTSLLNWTPSSLLRCLWTRKKIASDSTWLLRWHQILLIMQLSSSTIAIGKLINLQIGWQKWYRTQKIVIDIYLNKNYPMVQKDPSSWIRDRCRLSDEKLTRLICLLVRVTSCIEVKWAISNFFANSSFIFLMDSFYQKRKTYELNHNPKFLIYINHA